MTRLQHYPNPLKALISSFYALALAGGIFSLALIAPSQAFGQKLIYLVFPDNKSVVAQMFLSEFQREGFSAITENQWKQIVMARAELLSDAAVHETMKNLLDEYEEELDVKKKFDLKKILNGMAKAECNYYDVGLDFSVADNGKSPENEFHQVNLQLQELVIADLKKGEIAIRENGKQTGLGPNFSIAERNAAKRLTRKIARNISFEFFGSPSERKGKLVKLSVVNILNRQFYSKFAKTAASIIQANLDKCYDENQFSGTFQFTLAPEKLSEFLEKLVEEASHIDGMEELKILKEDSGIRLINITAQIIYP